MLIKFGLFSLTHFELTEQAAFYQSEMICISLIISCFFFLS